MRMNATEVTRLIESEIGEDWDRSNAHGVDLKVCLVPPALCRFENCFNPVDSIELWLVLEEDPQNKGGYMIVFDDSTREFGLAIHGTDQDVSLWSYGSFLDTLEGM